jgi:hypothetical protein
LTRKGSRLSKRRYRYGELDHYFYTGRQVVGSKTGRRKLTLLLFASTGSSNASSSALE